MFHYLKPEVKEKKEDKKPAKKEQQTIPVKVKTVEPVSVQPTATPAQIEQAIKTNFKNLAEMYKDYKKNKDPTQLRYFLKKAITEKESGVGTNEKLRLRLVNQAAINEKKRQYLLDRMGIKVPPLPGSSSKLVTEECLDGGFNKFKERVCSQLQPDIKDEVDREDKTAEILARCAIGKYQILPIYHIPGLGTKFEKKGNVKQIKRWSGNAKLLKIYQFITSEETQSKTADKIIDNLGQRYDWNPQSIMVAYYAGLEWANKLQSDQNNPAFTKKQYGGHGSMRDYINRTTALADNLIEKASRA